MNQTHLIVSLLALVMFVAGCGESGGPQPSEAEVTGIVSRRDGVATVHLTGNDQMKFNADAFTLRSGEKVRLVFEHIGQMPASTMGHNVAILKQGENAQQFSGQVLSNGGTPDNDYLPTSMADRVFAHTQIIGGGEKDVIEFTAPSPGEYPYLCTFPGHFVFMRGQMTVQ